MRGFRGDLFSVKSQDNNEYIIAQSSNIGNDSLNNRNRWLCKIPSDVKKLNDRTQSKKYDTFFGRIRAMHTYTVLSNVLNLQDQNLPVVQIAFDHRTACRLHSDSFQDKRCTDLYSAYISYFMFHHICIMRLVCCSA